MQPALHRSQIKSVMGISKSRRPCQVGTCGGIMIALLYKYEDRTHRLIFRCDRCHIEQEYGVCEATEKPVLGPKLSEAEELASNETELERLRALADTSGLSYP